MHHHPVRAAVGRAIKNGKLQRPDRCSKCNRRPKTRDGRSPIHAHHDDYKKPLDVIWLCASCHAARHVELGWGNGGETIRRQRKGKTIEQIREAERARFRAEYPGIIPMPKDEVTA